MYNLFGKELCPIKFLPFIMIESTIHWVITLSNQIPYFYRVKMYNLFGKELCPIKFLPFIMIESTILTDRKTILH